MTFTTLGNSSHESWPAWVHERVAVDGDGDLNTEVFSPTVLDGLRRFLGSRADGSCRLYTSEKITRPALLDDSGKTIGYDQIVLASELVVRGRVSGRAGGFRFGQPGTLYRIDASEFLKGLAPFRQFYFFVHAGEVRLGNQRICVVPSEEVPESLPDGAEVIVSVPRYDGGEFLDLSDRHPSRIVAGAEGNFVGFAWSGYREFVDDGGRGVDLWAAVERWMSEELLIYGDPVAIEVEEQGMERQNEKD
ncbi:MAG: hypothetical protein DWQ36_22455 [Acidobacteria bacterium]|nr:MAG: hypothetical protein DWQ30_13815 [Acidobacteriota bacterium]REK00526.1 MAG: hypothetical protein DWQ36_22455 [Acidobacteriota bacterium]